MNNCTRCGKQMKLVGKLKPRIRCRACDTKRLQDWKEKNPERVETWWRNNKAKNPDRERNNYLKRVLGSSLEEKNLILASQDEKCAICGTNKPGKDRAGKQSWKLDHDHQTKKIRGVLCQHCNLGLGLFKDDFNLLQVAATYLKGYSANI